MESDILAHENTRKTPGMGGPVSCHTKFRYYELQSPAGWEVSKRPSAPQSAARRSAKSQFLKIRAAASMQHQVLSNDCGLPPCHPSQSCLGSLIERQEVSRPVR